MRCCSLLILLLAVFISAAAAQGRIDCNSLNSSILKQSVHYCVMLPSGYDDAAKARPPRRYPVLYFLHGLGDNEQSMFKEGGWTLVEDLRRQKQISDFLIVAPEGRANFYINSADGRVLYNDFFVDEFIPYIEAHYSVRRERAARAISGVSMGGYGALRFAFAHPELFSSVSAQSAALITDSPQELTAAMRSGSELKNVLSSAFGNPIDIGHWNRNSPFVLAKQNRKRLDGLAIFFDCGRNDDFGFEKGAADLHQQLQAEGVPHEYHLYPGDHGSTFFLAHLGETMRFHSEAFAANAPAKPR